MRDERPSQVSESLIALPTDPLLCDTTPALPQLFSQPRILRETIRWQKRRVSSICLTLRMLISKKKRDDGNVRSYCAIVLCHGTAKIVLETPLLIVTTVVYRYLCCF